MALKDAADSFKEYLLEKQNPYFASVILLWMSIHKSLIVGIFLFDNEMRFADKLVWIRDRTYEFSVFGVRSPFFTLIVCFIGGFIVMALGTLTNAYGKAAYIKLIDYGTQIIRNAKESDYVENSKHIEVQKKHQVATSELFEVKNLLITEREKSGNLQNSLNNVIKEKEEFEQAVRIEINKMKDTVSLLESQKENSQRFFDATKNLIGKWKLSYLHDNKTGISQEVDILERRMLINGNHVQLSNVQVNGARVKFTKEDLVTHERINCNLLIINKNRMEGWENNLPVIYERMAADPLEGGNYHE